MKVTIKERYRSKITTDVINRILELLCLEQTYDIEYVRKDGSNIVIDDGEKKRYVIVSASNASECRNAFLSQYVPTVLKQYIDDDFKNKSIYVYLLDTSQKATAPFIIDTYRTLKNLDIPILNEEELGIKLDKYRSFKEWKFYKNLRQSRNTGNNASYAIEEQDEYIMYGKLYGANGKDASLMACLLKKISEEENKKFRVVQVKEHGTESISENDRKLLQYYGIVLSNESIVLDKKTPKAKSSCRKQDEFKYNLLEKYGEKKCCLCNCDIESMIIASHIHRITDIDNSDLDDQEKRRQAVDANNGLWLCANHDKLFENGIITFNDKGHLVINPMIRDEQKAYVTEITNSNKLEDKHITNELLEYMVKHNCRVHLCEK